ncbi:RHS repeat-associated core domain-containing protein [Bacteroidales bacterium OttesenSCG-928-I21]|nr:RHS repeat-associated core domain-containing protein [Bacteroidales bacterium OttesenSCG-928-I21]
MQTAETILYFYHTDHLGSTSFVSNAAGTPIQYLTYNPFGGIIQNKKATGSSYEAEFKFSGKLLDGETNYSYFGARYYDSGLGIWLSVDPLAHKYPRLSPYVYCANNPVMLVDPDGRSIDGYEDGHGNYQWFDDHTEASFTSGNTTWTKVTDDKKAWNQATTIRDAVITGLVKLGNSEADAKNDVRLFSSDSPLFTKEARINNSEKYTSGWDSKYNSETGTNEALQSINISNTGYSLKYYPTKGGMKNANAMWLVKSNSMAHRIEGGMEYIERMIFGSYADKDPISSMHYGNSRDFLNKVNGVYKTTPSTFNWTDAVYFKTGGRK